MGVGKAVRVVARTSRRVSHTAPAVHTVTHTVSGVSHLPSAVGLVSSSVAPVSAAASSTSATAAAAAARQAAVAKARQHRAKQQSKQIDKHRKDLQRNDVSKIRQKFTAKPVRGATKATVSRQKKLFPQTVPASHARLNPTASKVPEQKAAPKQAPQHAALKRAVSQIPAIGNSRQVAPFVVKQAKKRGLAPSVLMAQLEQESGFDPLATEHEGATISQSQGGGESQFIPSTAKAYGVKYGGSKKAVKSQLKGQAKYMADLGGART
jgi:soluble lytic murein transglycosylase-like protein